MGATLFAFLSFLTWVRDELLLRYAKDKYHVVHFLPHWRLSYWLLLFVSLFLVCAVLTGAKIWRENASLKFESLQNPPRLTLAYRKSDKQFVITNIGVTAAVNIQPHEIILGQRSAHFSLIAKLAPNEESFLTTTKVLQPGIPVSQISLAAFLATARKENHKPIEPILTVDYSDPPARQKFTSAWRIKCSHIVSDDFAPPSPLVEIFPVGSSPEAR